MQSIETKLFVGYKFCGVFMCVIVAEAAKANNWEAA